jgi:hypothetical protein
MAGQALGGWQPDAWWTLGGWWPNAGWGVGRLMIRIPGFLAIIGIKASGRRQLSRHASGSW